MLFIKRPLSERKVASLVLSATPWPYCLEVVHDRGADNVLGPGKSLVNTMAKRGISLQPSISSDALPQKTGKPSILNDLPPSVGVHCLGVEESTTRLNKLAIDIKALSRTPADVRAREFAASHNVDLEGYGHLAYLALGGLYPNSSESLRQQLADAMTTSMQSYNTKHIALGNLLRKHTGQTT